MQLIMVLFTAVALAHATSYHNGRLAVAIAAAFPELVRYNELSDFIEMTAMELLHVQQSSQAVDFSIGPLLSMYARYEF